MFCQETSPVANLKAHKGAVAVGRVVILVIRNIDRTNIDVLAVRNDGAGALRQVRQTGRQPLADQLVCSNRLDRTAVEAGTMIRPLV